MLIQTVLQAVRRGDTEPHLWSQRMRSQTQTRHSLFFCGNLLQVFIETYKGIGWCFHELLLWVLRSLSALLHPASILGITASSHPLIWSHTPMWSPPGCSGSTSLLQEPWCSRFGCLFPFQRELCLHPCAALCAGSCPSSLTAKQHP